MSAEGWTLRAFGGPLHGRHVLVRRSAASVVALSPGRCKADVVTPESEVTLSDHTKTVYTVRRVAVHPGHAVCVLMAPDADEREVLECLTSELPAAITQPPAPVKVGRLRSFWRWLRGNRGNAPRLGQTSRSRITPM